MTERRSSERVDGGLSWRLRLILAAVAVAAMPAIPAAAQEPASVSEPPADEYERVVDVTSRYRFLERYAVPGSNAPPGALGQYRVDLQVTTRRAIDRPEGAPDRSEGRLRLVYNEQAAAVGLSGTVTAAVRRYEEMKLAILPQPREGAEPLSREGVTLWYQARQAQAPRIISLVPGRRLQAFEYQVTRNQVFMPQLALALPAIAVRVGDTWPVSRVGVQSMLGDAAVRGDNITGHFVALNRSKRTGDYFATLSLTGQVVNAGGNTAINAQVVFKFPAPEPRDPDRTRKADEGLIEARGGIIDFRMGVMSTLIPLQAAPGARTKQTDSREVILSRELVSGDLPLQIPKGAPESTDENSWIEYNDPQARFQFRYPQDMQLSPTTTPDAIELISSTPGSPDLIRLSPSPDALDPEAMRKKLLGDWEKQGLQAIPGPYGWLPEEEWPDRRVYRIEAAMKVGGARGGLRVTFDGYVLQFRQKGTLYAEAYTPRDPPLPFRREVEDILRTFRYASPEAP